jgi:ParB family chromosome partitioning protein
MSEKRLGRGLEALLGPAVTREAAQQSGALRELPVAQIRPNPYQPRTTFDEQELKDLADSIAASGLLQPVVVRSKDGAFELIAGERRWRAVQRLGWQHVPAVVKEVDDRTLLTLALIENLQRDDLSPIDEALGFQRLIDEFAVPQAEVARLVGKDRSTVSNLLRLLKLPDAVRALVHAKQLSEGHARALLGLQGEAAIVKLAHETVAAGWSVREVEDRVRGTPPAGRARQTGRTPTPHQQTADARRIEDALRKRLGTDVKLTAKRKGRGLLAISYYSNDDLARLLEVILGTPFDG